MHKDTVEISKEIAKKVNHTLGEVHAYLVSVDLAYAKQRLLPAQASPLDALLFNTQQEFQKAIREGGAYDGG